MFTRNLFCLLLVPFAFAACGTDHHTAVTDGGAVEAGGGSGGSGGSGGTSGVGGSGGSGDDAAIDAGVTESWYATKTTLDVWWQGGPSRDPGRGNIEIYALTHVTGACNDDAGETTIKVCGIALPPFTSDVHCEAYQLEIHNSAWDSTSMPTFSARSIVGVDAGGVASKVATALIGIDLSDDATWPTPTMTTSVRCDDGTGAACFPDHDDDMFAGVTAHLRTDAATYVGPYDDGLCWNDTAYKFSGMPTFIDLGGLPRPVLADRLRMGIRTRLGFTATGTRCGGDQSGVYAPLFDTHAIGCTVDLTTLDSYDPRTESMDTTCTQQEVRFVGESLPQYRALVVGEAPGDSLAPSGWTRIGRDIDKRVSTGPRTTSIRLSNDTGSGTDPNCAQVRAAAFPSL